ncbi:MAG: thioredoxin domain-containing protein [Promethearchaeota archaeon]
MTFDEKFSNFKVIFFTKVDCSPCHKLEKALLEIIKKTKLLDLRIIKIAVTKRNAREVEKRYKITVLPTLILEGFARLEGDFDCMFIEEKLIQYITEVRLPPSLCISQEERFSVKPKLIFREGD